MSTENSLHVEPNIVDECINEIRSYDFICEDKLAVDTRLSEGDAANSCRGARVFVKSVGTKFNDLSENVAQLLEKANEVFREANGI